MAVVVPVGDFEAAAITTGDVGAVGLQDFSRGESRLVVSTNVFKIMNSGIFVGEKEVLFAVVVPVEDAGFGFKAGIEGEGVGLGENGSGVGAGI